MTTSLLILAGIGIGFFISSAILLALASRNKPEPYPTPRDTALIAYYERIVDEHKRSADAMEHRNVLLEKQNAIFSTNKARD